MKTLAAEGSERNQKENGWLLKHNLSQPSLCVEVDFSYISNLYLLPDKFKKGDVLA